jgi:hypothetical protein
VHSLNERPRQFDFASVQMRATSNLDPDYVSVDVEGGRRSEREHRFGKARKRRVHGRVGYYAHAQIGAFCPCSSHSLPGAHPECTRFARHDIDARISQYIAFGLHRAPWVSDNDRERRLRPTLPRDFESDTRQRNARYATRHDSPGQAC